jgi:hypothetical protein
MTLTDPTGDPDLLQRVVSTTHDRLDSLLTEAARRTDTPGVIDELGADLVAEVLGHLNAEAMVLRPEVGDVLGEPERRRLADESEALSSLATTARLTGDFDLLAGALTDHRQLVDTLLGRLRENADATRMAGLGYEYAHAAEAASHTHLT